MSSEQRKMNKKADEWINKSINEYIDGWINGESMNINTWMHERKIINGSMNHSMDDRQENRKTSGWQQCKLQVEEVEWVVEDSK